MSGRKRAGIIPVVDSYIQPELLLSNNVLVFEGKYINTRAPIFTNVTSIFTVVEKLFTDMPVIAAIGVLFGGKVTVSWTVEGETQDEHEDEEDEEDDGLELDEEKLENPELPILLKFNSVIFFIYIFFFLSKSR